MLRSQLLPKLRPFLRRHPRVKRLLINAETEFEAARHAAAGVLPVLIRPAPVRLNVAITAACNLRCTGCRYGRDFMPGAQLPLQVVREMLDDAAAGGVPIVRLYGGEPLLHRDLPEMVRHSVKVGVKPYVTTNGILLKEKFPALYDAGLRTMTIGFYGTGEDYNSYVHATRGFRKLEEGISTVRDRYGMGVEMQINFLLMKPSCSIEALRRALDFAVKYQLFLQTDLIHYSLPYFTEGPEGELQFGPGDEPAIRRVAEELLAFKAEHPHLYPEAEASIRSIPDWLLKGPEMRIPCDAYNLLWVGADGTVKLCYVTFTLGNLHQTRLREMLYSGAHAEAARGAFALRCPNCHCNRDTRIQKHYASRLKYRG